MKKTLLPLIIVGFISSTSASYGIVQAGVQMNYNSYLLAGNSQAARYTGFTYGGFGRITMGIPLIVTFGIGGYVDAGTLAKDSTELSLLRAGGELVLYLDIVEKIIGITPYARVGFGYEGFKIPTTYAIAGTTTTASADAIYRGTSTHTLIGLNKNLFPAVNIFLEGGLVANNLTAYIPSALSGTVTAADITTTGWRVSLGAMLWI